MIKRLSWVILGLLGVLSFQAYGDKPEVVILATGGTIAGSGESSVGARYRAAKLPIDKLLQAVPEIHNLAQLRGDQVAQVSSQAMTSEIWLTLARQVNEHVNKNSVSGVVITHGTDTLEETAYFLDLVIQTKKPVVVVGAMRPPSSLSADGHLNLYNAVALAASSKARNRGVMVVMNNVIHAARSVTKTHTTAVHAFQSPGKGPLGAIDYGQINFYRQAERVNRSPFNIQNIDRLPDVDIVYGYVNASPLPIHALVNAGTKGIVHAGVGNGNLFPSVKKALVQAIRQGTVVVRSSRVSAGHVSRNAEINDDKWGFVVADDLNPQKARILLMLALTQTKDMTKIQQWFYSL